MYAVVATGGKQYKVEQGQVLEVERAVHARHDVVVGDPASLRRRGLSGGERNRVLLVSFPLTQTMCSPVSAELKQICSLSLVCIGAFGQVFVLRLQFVTFG